MAKKKTLEIDITGPATVTAGDIIVDSDVEILNKDMYICSVSEGATFHARLTVKPGRGYVQADENKRRYANWRSSSRFNLHTCSSCELSKLRTHVLDTVKILIN